MAAQKAPGGTKGGPYEDELPLDLGSRLPWLETDDDGERDGGSGRLIAAIVACWSCSGSPAAASGISAIASRPKRWRSPAA